MKKVTSTIIAVCLTSMALTAVVINQINEEEFPPFSVKQ